MRYKQALIAVTELQYRFHIDCLPGMNENKIDGRCCKSCHAIAFTSNYEVEFYIKLVETKSFLNIFMQELISRHRKQV
jgi:hypothetical protein